MGWIAVLTMLLKYIGIVILIVLAILIILLLWILFSAVRYEVKGEYSSEKSWAYALVSWLFGLVRLEASYNGNDLKLKVRCPMKKLIRRMIVGEKKEKDDSKPVVKVASVEDEKIQPTEKINHQNQHKLKKTAKNKSVIDRIKDIYDRALTYYNEYDVKHLYRPVKRFILKFIKALGLRKIEADITFGFDDPSLTGMVLGGGAAVAALLPFNINLNGYFDGEYLNGRGHIKGKTCTLRLLIPVVRVLLEKPVWNFISSILNSDSNDTK